MSDKLKKGIFIIPAVPTGKRNRPRSPEEALCNRMVETQRNAENLEGKNKSVKSKFKKDQTTNFKIFEALEFSKNTLGFAIVYL